ncbi:MAG: hydrolase [Chlorobi bacterium]|jgi:8-oxo-dGTP pyrophosphatase MutT (NUDIX family)|nr:hydrolase [Chlorobiota bacterium]
MPISSHLRNLRDKVGNDLLQVPSVAAIIRDAGGRVLIQRGSESGRWSLPAGAIDPGEAPAEAIVREVREETGLRVIPVRVAGVFSGEGIFEHVYGNGDRVEYLVILFECRVVGGELGPLDGESLELRYVPVAEMPELVIGYPGHLFEMHNAGEAYFSWDDSWVEKPA